MFKSNPFFRLSPSAQKIMLYVLGISAFLLLMVLNMLDKPLKTASAPMGILSFELAHDFSNTQKILASWDFPAKYSAALSLYIDYLFLVIYSLFFAFSAFKIAGRLSEMKLRAAKIGVYIGWLQIVAGFFDALENYCLIKLLFGSQNEIFSIFASYFATLKFSILIIGIVYIIWGLILLKIHSADIQ